MVYTMSMTNTEKNLTPTQKIYLAEIREAGTRSYDGRAKRPLIALEEAGLIRCRYENQRYTGRGKDRYVAIAIDTERKNMTGQQVGATTNEIFSDGAATIAVTSTKSIRDLREGDILSDGRIVYGVTPGEDGDVVVYFKPERKIANNLVAYREHDEITVGDEVVFEDEGIARTAALIGDSLGLVGTNILFEGEFRSRFLEDIGPNYAIVVNS